MLPRIFHLLISSLLFLGATNLSPNDQSLRSLCKKSAVSASQAALRQTPLWNILEQQHLGIELLFTDNTQSSLRNAYRSVYNTLPYLHAYIASAHDELHTDIQQSLNTILQTNFTYALRITPELSALLEELETPSMNAALICPQNNAEATVQNALQAFVGAMRRLLLSAPLTHTIVSLDNEAGQKPPNGGIAKKDMAELAAQFKRTFSS
jgi:hypothetical protein